MDFFVVFSKFTRFMKVSCSIIALMTSHVSAVELVTSSAAAVHSTGATTPDRSETALHLHASEVLYGTVARRAATFNVSTEVALKAALADGNNVTLMQNITLSSTIDISNGTVVIDGQGLYSIDGNGTVQCIRIAGISTSVAITGLVIKNGNAIRGGGLNIAGGTVVMTACTVSNNFAFSSSTLKAMLGGGLYIDGGTVTMTSCVVSSNTVSPSSSYENSGGGVFLNSGKLTMVSCSITNNSANDAANNSGGGLSISGGECTMITCIVANNHASGGFGGGLFMEGGTCTLTSCAVTNNSVSDDGIGGGFFIFLGSTCTLTSCTVTNNSANAGPANLFNNAGGGLFIVGTCTLISCTVSDNYASAGTGAGLNIYGGNCTMISCSVTNNTAIGGEDGGGLNMDGGNCTMIACTVTNNRASYGGGLYYSDGACILISCIVANNTAIAIAGGNDVYIESGLGLKFLSDCASMYYKVGIGVLDCFGCTTPIPADLLTTSCTAVPSGQFSCCGATGYFSSQPTCSEALVNVCSLCPSGQVSAFGKIPCAYCATAGQFSYAGGRTCLPCPAGRYNPGTLGVCNGCPNGKYSSTVGEMASSSCIPCSSTPVQLVSIQGSSSCSPGCPAGYYKGASNTCFSCSEGQYQSNPNEVNCIPCDAGTYLSATGQTSSLNCIDCPLGYQSSIGASSCIPCRVGQYGTNSPAGRVFCTSCPAGQSSGISGSSSSTDCIPCSEGQYSPGPGAPCASCSAGLYLASTESAGSSKCISCPPGTASGVTGAQSFDSCTECPLGRTSNKGSSNCPLADVGSYLSTDTALSATTPYTPDLRCPSGALCRGGVATPRPVEGYWSSHDSLELADQIFLCNRKTCQGAADSPYNPCWQREGFASAACQDGSLTCSVGASGPLCGSCIQSYIYSDAKLVCTACRTASTLAYTVAGVLGALGLTAAALSMWWAWLPIWVTESWAAKMLRLFDRAKCKIAWSTYQIIGSVSVSLSVEWPPIFQDFLQSLSILSFDFLSPDCFVDNSSFYQTVVIWTIIPIIVSGGFGLSLAVRLVQAHAWSSASEARKSARQLHNTHLNYFLVLTYLVLPAVLVKQFQALDCVHVAGRRYVQVDTSIDCDTQLSQNFRILDSLFITLYLGIPALWLILLCRRRTQLNPAPNDLRFALFLRDSDDSLTSLRFLFDIYLPEYYFFEVIEMGRRVGLIGVLPLLSDVAARRACYGLCFSLCGWAFYREIEPFRNSKDNSLNYVAQVAISLTYAAALVIATGLNEGVDVNAFGAVLVSINFAVLLLAVLLTYSHWRFLEAEKAVKLRKRATKIEDAIQFNQMKFRTTFEALENNQVANSECLVFWYCSLTDAQFALQRGIPVSEAHNGIVFSLHRPYQLDEIDQAHFAECSAVVVAALPRRLLFSPPLSLVGSHLRLLPAETLLALRSPFFQDLVDPELWHCGEVFFPPLKIARIFQILPDTRRLEEAFIPLRNVVQTSLFDGSVCVPKSCADFVHKMQTARNVCDKHGWVPLYHYTDVKWARNIIEGGFRMSTQGQGDGGVYFSVRGPTSYGVGTDKYEANIITDCFGAGRTHDYLGKSMLDVVFVYGMEVGALTQAPGGRDNAFMVSKALFELLALPAPDGNFFLRPDRILGVFLINADGCLPGLEAAQCGIESERCLDLASKNAIVASLSEMDENDTSVASLLRTNELNEPATDSREDAHNVAQPARLAERLSSLQEKSSEDRVSNSIRFRLSSQQIDMTESARHFEGRAFSVSNPSSMQSDITSVQSPADKVNQRYSSSNVWATSMMHQRSSMRDNDSLVTSHNFL